MSEKQPFDTNRLIDFIINPRYRYWRHFLFILCLIPIFMNISYIAFYEHIDNQTGVILAGGFASSIFIMGGLYLNMTVLVPKLLMRNRIVAYLFSVTIVITLSLSVSFGWEYAFFRYYDLEPGRYSYFSADKTLLFEIIVAFFVYAMTTAGTSMIVLFRYWYDHSRRKNELEKSNLQSELMQLRDQVNPHFLFSTLEKAEELTPIDPERSSRLLMLLSKHLRYQLYDCNRDKVLLVSEINFVDNFLKIRALCQGSFSYSLNVIGGVHRVQLPPLLFIPFIEYAVSNQPTGKIKACMHLLFRLEDGIIELICISSKAVITPNESVREEDGLTKINRRLELMYGDRFEKTIESTDETLSIQLRLHL